MRKHDHQWVCRCTPTQGVVYMTGSLWNLTVAQGETLIRQTPNLRLRAYRALRLGLLCQHTGHPLRAFRIWQECRALLHDEDEEWGSPSSFIHPKYFSLEALTSGYEASLLGKAMDKLLRQTGHPEMAAYEEESGMFYKYLWLDHYYESVPDFPDMTTAQFIDTFLKAE